MRRFVAFPVQATSGSIWRGCIMTSSRVFFTMVAGVVGVVACSNSSRAPAPTSGDLNVESCSCLICPCQGTGNQCTHNTCDYISYGVYKCQPHPWLDSRSCNDNAAHHGNGYYCIESGHCDQNGSCSPYVGSGNTYYTCDQNQACSCGCTYDEGSGVYGCCSQSSFNCMNAPTCVGPVPPPPSTCNGSVPTPDNYCTMYKRCN